MKFQTLCSLFQVSEVPEAREEVSPFADEDARGRVENLLTAFRSHMEIESDPPKQLTRTKYVSSMRRFLKDEAKKCPSWDPSNLLEMDRPGDRIPKLPGVQSCFSGVKPVSSRHGIIYAYQKFVGFLQARLDTFEMTMCEDRFKDISEHLERRLAQTKLGGPRNQKRMVQGRNQNRKEALRRGDWKERPVEVFTLMAKFLKCETVNHLLDNLEQLDLDKFVVRNFLMCLCLVVCGGLRPDVARGMTLAEWRDRKITRASKGTARVWEVKVQDHKTGQKGDAMFTFHDRRVERCLEYFIERIRPLFLKNSSQEDLSLPVFLDREGKKVQKICDATRWFTSCVVKEGWYTRQQMKGFTSYCFRVAVATWGSGHNDQAIRANIAVLQVCMLQLCT